jgi:hypothetical protein
MICNLIKECSIEFKNSEKTLVDKKGGGSKYLINNSNKNTFALIDFETCVYKNNQNDTKFDFGINTENIIYFIELKGSDVK